MALPSLTPRRFGVDGAPVSGLYLCSQTQTSFGFSSEVETEVGGLISAI